MNLKKLMLKKVHKQHKSGISFYGTPKQLAKFMLKKGEFSEEQANRFWSRERKMKNVYRFFVVGFGDKGLIGTDSKKLISSENVNRKETIIKIVTNGLNEQQINQAIRKLQKQLDKHSKNQNECNFIEHVEK
jgi:hypothetical protein